MDINNHGNRDILVRQSKLVLVLRAIVISPGLSSCVDKDFKFIFHIHQLIVTIWFWLLPAKFVIFVYFCYWNLTRRGEFNYSSYKRRIYGTILREIFEQFTELWYIFCWFWEMFAVNSDVHLWQKQAKLEQMAVFGPNDRIKSENTEIKRFLLYQLPFARCNYLLDIDTRMIQIVNKMSMRRFGMRE